MKNKPTFKLPNLKKINVISTLPFQTNANASEIAPAPVLHTQHRPASSTLFVKVLKTVVVPIFALFSSLSLPILIILIQNQPTMQEPRSLEDKILKPLLPYAMLVALRAWLLWNSVGHRLNGRVDAEIQPAIADAENDPVHVTSAILANSATFTTEMLGALVILTNAPPIVRWTGAVFIGGLNFTKEFFTEVVDAFRKHVESKLQRGRHIKPFFKQKYIEHSLDSARNFGFVLRDTLPSITGIIRTVVISQSLKSALKNHASSQAITGLNIPLGMLIYWSSAYATRFDLVQFRDNIQAAGKRFNINNTLSHSGIKPVRIVGKIVSGQILIDLLLMLRLSTKASVNVTLFFNALGLMTFLQKALHTYVSSRDSAAVATGNEGIVMTYMFGQATQHRIAPAMEVGIACVAVTLSALGTFARSATLHKQAELEAHPHTVNPSAEGGGQAHEEENDTSTRLAV